MRDTRLDEYGCELTEEEVKELDEIAQEAADAVFGPKKRGRKKKDETAAADPVEEKAPEKDEKLNMFTTRTLPIEVRSAIEDKMEVYERAIASYEADIKRIKESIKATEAKYTVLANYLKGAYDEGRIEEREPAGGSV